MAHDIILVDEYDRPVGRGEKIAVHKAGRLHRCFSVFVFNAAGQLLLQKRSAKKYHSGGLWTNTTCSHPSPGEKTRAAAEHRLREEMGIDCRLEERFSFVYQAELANGLTEHEYDHVFFGVFDGEPVLDPMEADDWRWVNLQLLQQDVTEHPERYTVWLRACLSRVIEAVQEKL